MKNKKLVLPLIALVASSISFLSSCSSNSSLSKKAPSIQKNDLSKNYIDDNYKNYYQVLVQSFCDSNGDGIGDLKGLINKLDYLNSGKSNDLNSLGVDGIYTLPIFKSPTYHKYDVIDYKTIDPNYGTMDDFDKLVLEAKSRGISIILDLPINHTSTQNNWFIESAKSIKLVGSNNLNSDGTIKQNFIDSHPYVDYYNWKKRESISSTEINRYRQLSGTTWYYEAFFDKEMPDLNLSNLNVQNEIKGILRFWLNKGIKGFRLDGVEHYYDSSKELTYEFCNKLYQWCYDIVGNDSFYLVGEGPWSSDVSNYYANTKIPSYMNFYYGNFPNTSTNKGQINALFKNESTFSRFKSINKNDVYENEDGDLYDDPNFTHKKTSSNSSFLKEIIEKWDRMLYSEVNPNASNAIDANFLTNHDTVREITRIKGFSLYGDDKEFSSTNLQRLKMAWAINHLMRGTSFTYYGEEIGMTTGKQYTGSSEYKNDPNKRHPMYWTSDLNASGSVRISKIPGADSVEQLLPAADAQIKDKKSLWNFFREIFRLKSFYPAIARGTQKVVYSKKNVVVIEKSYNGEKLYVVYNISNKNASLVLNDVGLNNLELKYVLSTDQTYSTLKNNKLNMPDYSVTILK